MTITIHRAAPVFVTLYIKVGTEIPQQRELIIITI